MAEAVLDRPWSTFELAACVPHDQLKSKTSFADCTSHRLMTADMSGEMKMIMQLNMAKSKLCFKECGSISKPDNRRTASDLRIQTARCLSSGVSIEFRLHPKTDVSVPICQYADSATTYLKIIHTAEDTCLHRNSCRLPRFDAASAGKAVEKCCGLDMGLFQKFAAWRTRGCKQAESLPAHCKSVSFSHGRPANDFNAKIQISDHSADDPPLLIVLLAKNGNIWFHNVEKLGDDLQR